MLNVGLNQDRNTSTSTQARDSTKGGDCSHYFIAAVWDETAAAMVMVLRRRRAGDVSVDHRPSTVSFKVGISKKEVFDSKLEDNKVENRS